MFTGSLATQPQDRHCSMVLPSLKVDGTIENGAAMSTDPSRAMGTSATHPTQNQFGNCQDTFFELRDTAPLSNPTMAGWLPLHFEDSTRTLPGDLQDAPTWCDVSDSSMSFNIADDNLLDRLYHAQSLVMYPTYGPTPQVVLDPNMPIPMPGLMPGHQQTLPSQYLQSSSADGASGLYPPGSFDLGSASTGDLNLGSSDYTFGGNGITFPLNTSDPYISVCSQMTSFDAYTPSSDNHLTNNTYTTFETALPIRTLGFETSANSHTEEAISSTRFPGSGPSTLDLSGINQHASLTFTQPTYQSDLVSSPLAVKAQISSA